MSLRIDSRAFRVCANAALSLLLAGCGANPQSAASHGDKAFQSATPEVRSAWQTAAASLKTNNFALALDTLKHLHAVPSLTQDQMKAIETTATATSDKMYAAANAGDANAKKSIEELRQLQNR
jgi:hypothetical protein